MSAPDMTIEATTCGSTALPTNPFVSNQYHFGMLLGVADLETEQGYHRGKTWMHNAWLHGAGVVWGLRVQVRADRNELVVHPGLAIDHHGRELSVTSEMCIDLGAWFAERRPDELEVTERPDGGLTFPVGIELCHESCLDRPVPSISEPCDGSDLDTSYSRAIERGLPRVVPGPVAVDSKVLYPRLRQLVGQAPRTDATVQQAVADIEAADPTERAGVCLGWFRWLAAEDVMVLEPEGGPADWSPVEGDGCVLLAAVAVHLRPDGTRFVVVDDGDEPTSVDNRVRPSHVRTRTIQELLCHLHGTGPAAPDPADPDDGGGDDGDAGVDGGDAADTDGDADTGSNAARVGIAPRAVRNSVELDGTTIRLSFTEPLADATVHRDAFEVSTLRADGWGPVEVRSATADDTATTVTLRLRGAPRSRPVRVRALGTGRTPLLGANGRLLSGTEADPATESGADASLLIEHEEE